VGAIGVGIAHGYAACFEASPTVDTQGGKTDCLLVDIGAPRLRKSYSEWIGVECNSNVPEGPRDDDGAAGTHHGIKNAKRWRSLQLTPGNRRCHPSGKRVNWFGDDDPTCRHCARPLSPDPSGAILRRARCSVERWWSRSVISP